MKAPLGWLIASLAVAGCAEREEGSCRLYDPSGVQSADAPWALDAEATSYLLRTGPYGQSDRSLTVLYSAGTSTLAGSRLTFKPNHVVTAGDPYSLRLSFDALSAQQVSLDDRIVQRWEPGTDNAGGGSPYWVLPFGQPSEALLVLQRLSDREVAGLVEWRYATGARWVCDFEVEVSTRPGTGKDDTTIQPPWH